MAGRPKRSIDRAAIIKNLEESDAAQFDQLVTLYYAVGVSEVEKKRIRNAVIDVGTILMDYNFEEFADDYISWKKQLDTGAEIGSMATAAVATLVGPASTKAIWAAISGGITAANGSINKNFFYEKTIPVLFKQMQANRLAVRVDIQNRIKLSTDEYPLNAALTDLGRYYTAGTIDGALSDIQQQAAQVQLDAKADLKKNIRDDLETTISATTRARQWIQTNGIGPARTLVLDWYNSLDFDLEEDLAFFLSANSTAAVLAKLQLSSPDFDALFPEDTSPTEESYHLFLLPQYVQDHADADSLAEFIGSFHEQIELPG